jgi:hypothetical protein
MKQDQCTPVRADNRRVRTSWKRSWIVLLVQPIVAWTLESSRAPATPRRRAPTRCRCGSPERLARIEQARRRFIADAHDLRGHRIGSSYLDLDKCPTRRPVVLLPPLVGNPFDVRRLRVRRDRESQRWQTPGTHQGFVSGAWPSGGLVMLTLGSRRPDASSCSGRGGTNTPEFATFTFLHGPFRTLLEAKPSLVSRRTNPNNEAVGY